MSSLPQDLRSGEGAENRQQKKARKQPPAAPWKARVYESRPQRPVSGGHACCNGPQVLPQIPQERPARGKRRRDPGGHHPPLRPTQGLHPRRKTNQPRCQIPGQGKCIPQRPRSQNRCNQQQRPARTKRRQPHLPIRQKDRRQQRRAHELHDNQNSNGPKLGWLRKLGRQRHAPRRKRDRPQLQNRPHQKRPRRQPRCHPLYWDCWLWRLFFPVGGGGAVSSSLGYVTLSNRMSRHWCFPSTRPNSS